MFISVLTDPSIRLIHHSRGHDIIIINRRSPTYNYLYNTLVGGLSTDYLMVILC